MIFLLDADLSGTDSILRRIESGGVTHLKCGSYKQYDDHAMSLVKRRAQPGDTVILDTFTTMLASTRGDYKHSEDPGASVWESRHAYFGDKQALNSYQAAGNMVMRVLRNLRSVGYNIIALAHEDEALDEATMTTKRNIKANNEARDMLLASSSDVFRLVNTPEDVVVLDGEGNTQVVLKKDERVMLLRSTRETLAKFHVDIEQAKLIPDGIKEPTMEKLRGVLKKTPTFLVVYGLPGAGKTTFATSDAA